MRLYITQKDFDEGVEANCRLCPVGRSANREAERHGYWGAEVGHSNIRFLADDGIHVPHAEVKWLHGAKIDCVRPMPDKVKLFISNFDQGKINTFKPFSFSIQDIPDLTAGNPG